MLYPNHLTAGPNDYLAFVQDQTSRSNEEIIDVMINRSTIVAQNDAVLVAP